MQFLSQDTELLIWMAVPSSFRRVEQQVQGQWCLCSSACHYLSVSSADWLANCDVIRDIERLRLPGTGSLSITQFLPILSLVAFSHSPSSCSHIFSLELSQACLPHSPSLHSHSLCRLPFLIVPSPASPSLSHIPGLAAMQGMKVDCSKCKHCSCSTWPAFYR